MQSVNRPQQCVYIQHEVPPTRREALQAMFVLRKYTNVINDPLAHTVEMNLGSFAWKICMEEMHNMKDTKITSYFTRKE